MRSTECILTLNMFELPIIVVLSFAECRHKTRQHGQHTEDGVRRVPCGIIGMTCCPGTYCCCIHCAPIECAAPGNPADRDAVTHCKFKAQGTSGADQNDATPEPQTVSSASKQHI